MRVMTFTGWGQKVDALASIVPEGATASHIHYQHFEGYKELLPFLKGKHCDVAIGWSLGGQIVLRAVSEGIIFPQLVVLLATPFEFLVGPTNPFGMDITSFNNFERDFYTLPVKTQRKFSLLMNKYDTKASSLNKEILASLPSPEGWLIWLRELKYFSCAELNLSLLPKTLIIHGARDAVVSVEQAYMLQRHIRGSSIAMLEDAGHAPQRHTPSMVRQFIQRDYENVREFADV